MAMDDGESSVALLLGARVMPSSDVTAINPPSQPLRSACHIWNLAMSAPVAGKKHTRWVSSSLVNPGHGQPSGRWVPSQPLCYWYACLVCSRRVSSLALPRGLFRLDSSARRVCAVSITLFEGRSRKDLSRRISGTPLPLCRHPLSAALACLRHAWLNQRLIFPSLANPRRGVRRWLDACCTSPKLE